MKRLHVFETENGWLVISGDGESLRRPSEVASVSYTFNSLDKAMGHIRKVIKAWHQKPVVDTVV